MENKKEKSAVGVWFSGFFAFGALAHLVRVVFRVPLVVANWDVPLGVSLAVAGVMGVLAVLCLCGKICCPCSKGTCTS